MISDIHGNFSAFNPKKLPACDIALIAGDLTNHGFYAPAHVQPQATRETQEARVWFEELSRHVQKIFWVQGNHDRGIPDAFLNPFAVNIRDQSVNLEFDGIQFSLRGVSLTCAFDHPSLVKQWAYTTADPSEDTAVFDFGPHNIIVSHGPPYGCRDRTNTGSHIRPLA